MVNTLFHLHIIMILIGTYQSKTRTEYVEVSGFICKSDFALLTVS